MTALNPAIGAKPGEAFIARDGSTWMRQSDRFAQPWLEIANDEVVTRSQKQAEASGLVKLVPETEKLVEALNTAAWVESVAEGRLAGVSLGDRVRIVPSTDLVLPGSKNPNRLRTPEALRLAAEVMEEAARGRPQPATELMNAKGLRAEADRLDREHAEAEQDTSDGKRAEAYAALWKAAPEYEAYRDLALLVIRAERARQGGKR